MAQHVVVGLILDPKDSFSSGGGLPSEQRAPLADQSRGSTLRPSTSHIMCRVASHATAASPGGGGFPGVVVDLCAGVGLGSCIWGRRKTSSEATPFTKSQRGV